MTRLLILFGSQTGEAKDVAFRIGREARLRGFVPSVVSMSEYPVTDLPSERLVVFVASTTGQGDPPDNMRSFWSFLLRKSLPPDSLSGASYAVFGLGDSGYAKYNVVAKRLDARIAGLGGDRIIDLGLGDDQDRYGYDQVRRSDLSPGQEHDPAHTESHSDPWPTLISTASFRFGDRNVTLSPAPSAIRATLRLRRRPSTQREHLTGTWR